MNSRNGVIVMQPTVRLSDQEDEFVHFQHQAIPEKRLLANVLQRALLDILQMYEPWHPGMEDASVGECLGELFVAAQRPKRVLKVGRRCHEEGTLIRWFKSTEDEPFSFVYILRHLKLECLRSQIIHIVSTETAADRPNLSRTV